LVRENLNSVFVSNSNPRAVRVSSPVYDLPVGAVQTAGGYDIVWQISATNEFTFWTLDCNGNYTSNITDGLLTGAALNSFETLFHQDFSVNDAIGSAATFQLIDGH
jgi:hypothetical protein